MEIRKVLVPQKNIKIFYYLKGVLRELIPKSFYRSLLKSKLSEISQNDLNYLSKRLNYYNKLSGSNTISNKALEISTFTTPDKGTVYYYDFIEYGRFFNRNLRFNLLVGDVTHVPADATITKSRPINGNNQNSVLLNLNKVRHFTFVKYDIPYTSKKNMLAWRGNSFQKHREKFLEMYFNHPLCDIGKVNGDKNDDTWLKEKNSINKQLENKFILCIEGFDVASNLKWVMSSNSLAVMPQPIYETWFMEGTLIPDFHYIAIKDDYSDLEEKLTYYLKHPEKAQQISKNANEYVKQFKNKKREDLLSLLVLEKYFVKTGQVEQYSSLQY